MAPGAESHPLSWAHPVVQAWFLGRFGAPTEPQEMGWPPILARRNVLISAPTGSGKTLAAFLACLDRLICQGIRGELADRTEVLYVSPLKALGNDIQKNLEAPLMEITQRARELGLPMPAIRTAVRSGDTLQAERRAMLKRPPHILVTTPESLYILLTAEKSRRILQDIDTVIVDEIHALAGNKRGAHLSLSLERLDNLVQKKRGQSPVRIGLSATQNPIEVISRFLVGARRPEPVVVNVGHRRRLDLAIEVPASELGAVASTEMWEEVYDRLAALVGAHRSTLVFVNTRRLAERVAHHLTARLGEAAVAAHHGSLARKLRLEAERRLKSGQARVLVATASLELGIDVGTVDLVCQISSPRSIALALQRIGRSGHWQGTVPRGRLFALTRDDLVECAALVRAIRRGELDRIRLPESPLDILAQQIVAACACEDWNEGDLLALVSCAYPYRDLGREEFETVLGILSEGIAARRGRYGAFLHRDRVNGRVRARRGARLAAILNGGAIPETALYAVLAEPEGTVVGTVDEDFAVESLSGDIMLLGSASWRIRRVETAAGRVLVEDAQGAPPNIPFWRGEAPARTQELSQQVAELRECVDGFLSAGRRLEAVAWLKEECCLGDPGAEQLVEYVAAGRAALGAVPSQTTVIAERFFDESGGMQLVIHAPFGGRLNRAWGLALRKRFCQSFNFELQAAATEEGINISLGEQHSFPLSDLFHFLHPSTAKPVLEQAALASPLFNTRWRWDATRALALPRFRSGAKIPLRIQRMMSDDLLAAVFPDAAACQDNIQGDIRIPDHPLIREVMKDVLTEAMDLSGLERVLAAIADGSIRCLSVDTPEPSQFAHEILNANPYAYLDDAPLEERRARAVSMRRTLPETALAEIGRLDPEAIEQVRREAWPDVRDADELEDTLHTLVALPEAHVPPGGVRVAVDWGPYFEDLTSDRRATRAIVDGIAYWVPASKVKVFALLFPGAAFATEIPALAQTTPSREEALLGIVRGWSSHLGPMTSEGLATTLGLPSSDIEQALLHLEAQGAVLRGRFTGCADQEWCERRWLARIHRLTLGILRKEIQPVTQAQFMRWLLRWQHVAPGTQVLGDRGALEVIRQLQGFEAPARAWEPQILSRRIGGYDPEILDRLCLTGAVGWGRISPHPAILWVTEGSAGTLSERDSTLLEGLGGYGDGQDSGAARRVFPASTTPITFFLRGECQWMLPHRKSSEGTLNGLGNPAREVYEFLRARGASFFTDIVRGTRRLKSEVETALWELVSVGLATADGFDNLRAFLDPRRRAGQGRGRMTRPRHGAGRWSLMLTAEPGEITGLALEDHGSEGYGPSRSGALEAATQVLLNRYGVMFRELLARETFPFRWRDILLTLRRLEDRGVVRGGRFVDGFLGEQFALPLAVESLRAARKAAECGDIVMVSAADPLNLVGIILPGGRVPANSDKWIAFCDGVPTKESTNFPAARCTGAAGLPRAM
jgi:ATP-dependent Lhr-like helicase